MTRPLPAPSTLVPLVTLGLFCALASYSYARKGPPSERGYAADQVRAVNALADAGAVYRAAGDDWLSQLQRSPAYRPLAKRGRP